MTQQATPIQCKTNYFFSCPACNSDEHYSIDHLFKSVGEAPGSTYTFGPWTCKRCQHQIKGTLTRVEFGKISLTTELTPIPEKDRIVEGLALLRSTNAGGQDPFYVIVHDTYVHAVHGEQETSQKAYYYDEHTCPTNWSRHAVALVQGVNVFVQKEDTDPHGLFEYVEHLTRPEIDKILIENHGLVLEDLNDVGGEHIEALFPRLFKKTIDGLVNAAALSGPDTLRLPHEDNDE